MALGAHETIAAIHVLFVVPLFLFIGMKRSAIPEELYTLLLVLGVVVLGFHLYKWSVKYNAGVGGQWVNVIHVLLVAPLLLYIGANKKDTPRFAYEGMLITGFGALGYHLMTLIRALN